MLGFCGVNLLFDEDALNSPASNVLSINSVELRNGVIEHFNVTRDVTTARTSVIPTEWVVDTIMNATFTSGISAGNVDYISDQLSSVRVKRKVANDASSKWQTFFTISVTDPSDLQFTLNDYTVQSNVSYVYALVPVLTQSSGGISVEVEGNYETSNAVQALFDGIFICSKDTFYRLYAGMNYGDVSTIQLTGVHQPLGSTYPIVVANSKLAYHEGSMGGTVMPADYDEDLELDRLEIVKRRESLEKFFTDKKPKVLKDGNGNIWLVMFVDDVSFTFDNSWGMGIGDISASWVEIGDAKSTTDLNAAGIIETGGV